MSPSSCLGAGLALLRHSFVGHPPPYPSPSRGEGIDARGGVSSEAQRAKEERGRGGVRDDRSSHFLFPSAEGCAIAQQLWALGRARYRFGGGELRFGQAGLGRRAFFQPHL